MEFSTIKDIKAQTACCLKENMARAISLTFVLLFSLYLVNLFDSIIESVIELVGMQGGLLTRVVSLAISLVLCLVFTFPIWINIKKWYMRIEAECRSKVATLSMIGGVRTYFKTVLYGTVKFLIVWLMIAATFVPAIIMGSLSRFLWSEGSVNILYGVTLILTIIFVIISLCYTVYILISTFFADYLYIEKITTNPFTAIMLSFKISRHNRTKFAALFISLVPWFLMSGLIVPLLFTIPYINAAFAIFAKMELQAYYNTDAV